MGSCASSRTVTPSGDVDRGRVESFQNRHGLDQRLTNAIMLRDRLGSRCLNSAEQNMPRDLNHLLDRLIHESRPP
jgi:hypothetical protein